MSRKRAAESDGELDQFFSQREGEKKERLKAGAISQLHLVNFMSHANFTADFCSGVNFVVGANGSGKSAILAAICVAFGITGRKTNRTEDGVKGLVRTDTNSSTITLRLTNKGVDAFRAEEYGPEIVIERTISVTGGNTLKLKSASGKVVSSKRDELLALRDHFNIDVENPINVMTQDTSRQFLHQGNAKDKYKFFIKATLLEQIQNDLRFVHERCGNMTALIARQEERLPSLEAQKKALDEELFGFEAAEKLKELSEHLKKRIAWSLVAGAERAASEARQKVVEVKGPWIKEEGGKDLSMLAKLEKEIGKHETTLPGLEAEKKECFDALAQTNADTDARSAHIKAAAAAAKEAQNLLNQTRRQITETQKDVRAARIKQERLRKDVEGARETEAVATQQVRAAADASTGEARDAVAAAQEEREEATARVGECDSALRAAERARQEAEREERDCAEAVRQLEGSLRTLESSKGNTMRLFGEDMPKLLDRIAANKDKFSCPPLGPIGAHITLNDQKWALATEVVIGQMLGNFIVASAADGRKLQELGRGLKERAGANSGYERPMEIGVTVVPSLARGAQLQPYAIPAERLPPSELRTVLSVLSSPSAAVTNLLIDQARVESKVLLDDEQQCFAVAHGGGGSGPAPNVGEVISSEGVRYFKRNRDNARIPFNGVRRPSRLATDISAQQADCKKRLAIAQETRGPAERRRQAAVQAEAQASAALKAAARARDQATTKLNYAQRDLRNAEAEAAVAAAAGAAGAAGGEDDEADLEAALQAAMDEESQAAQIVAAAMEEEKEQLAEVEALEKQNRAARAEADKIKGSIEELQDNFTAAGKKLDAAKHTLSHLKNTVRPDLLSKIADLETLAAEREKEAAEAAQKAGQICSAAEAAAAPLPPKSPASPSREELDKMLAETERRIAKELKRNKRPYAEVVEDLEAKERELEKLTKLVLAVKGPALRLAAAFKKRKLLLRKTANFIKKSVAHNFNHHMSSRGHSGSVNVSYIDGTLELVVQLSNGGASAAKAVKDTKQLSGGERSFTTLCFTLSMNKLSESPFAAMDEWDVFMDNVHRKVSLDKMMEYTADEICKQFILFTPNDLGDLQTSEFVTLQTMKKPRAN